MDDLPATGRAPLPSLRGACDDLPMIRPFRALCVSSLCLVAFACSGGSEDEATSNGSTSKAGAAGKSGGGAAGQSGTCVPGQQVACACPGSAQSGVQVCNAQGTGLGACTGCPGGAGGAGGAGGSAAGAGGSTTAGTAGATAGGAAGAAAAGSAGTTGGKAGGTTGGAAGTGGASGSTTGGGAGTAGSSAGSAGTGGAKSCDQPDVLFALDRTLTMHKTVKGETPTDAPLYASSKWVQAIAAIEKVTATTDQEIRYGLELWPKNPGSGCITLVERITNTVMATNPSCQEGEIAIPPALGTGATIASYLDPYTTQICITTPTGQALITAGQYLAANVKPGRPQYVVLVTDGADWDQSCPTPNPLGEVQKLAAAGVSTFVVGFSAEQSVLGGVGIEFLNDMACGGKTAVGFPAGCMETANGWVSTKSSTKPQFLTAQNATELETVLAGSIGTLGCKP